MLRRQADRVGVERRIALGLGGQRVQARAEVAVGAVGLDQRRGGLHGLEDRLVGDAVGGGGRGRGRGGGRRRRRGRRSQLDPERREDPVVEAVLALQVGLDDGQEAARLGPLDDPVVVGRGHRHDLLGADHVADVLKPDRVADRAGSDDRALADHQPRHRGDRAQAARVGERDVGAGQVVGAQRVRARLVDEPVVGVLERGEAHPPGVADDRDHQRARAVLLLDVDGDAEVDLPVVDAVRLAVDVGEVVGHHRHVAVGAERDRVGDQMGEGDALAGVLELAPAAVHRRHGQRAERGRGRDRPALVHVAGEHPGAAAQRLGLAAGRGRGGRRGRGDAVAVGAARTSAFVIRPPGPLPVTEPRSIPSAAATRAATGEILASSGSGAAGAAVDAPLPASVAGSASRAGAAAAAPLRRRGHAGDDLADGDRGAGLDQHLGDRAGRGRGQLDVDLVGRDLGHGLAVLRRRRPRRRATPAACPRSPTRPRWA